MNINGKKIVFVVGSPRSGTTWLQLLLAQSSAVATTHETHLFNLYLQSPNWAWRHFRNQDRDMGLASLVSEKEFFSWIDDFSRLIVDRIAARRLGATIVVEKTPNHGHFVTDILRVFPAAYFIHAVRDPRGVVASVCAAASTWAVRWAPKRLKAACDVWNKDIAQAQAIKYLTPRYREVFYERLHADGAGELVRLFEWLGEPISRAEAERYVAACAIDKLRAGDADAPWDLKTEPAAFFRRGESEAWREDLSPSDIAIVERSTKKLMQRLGYQPVSDGRARAIASLRLRAYRTANAFALGARAFADRVKP